MPVQNDAAAVHEEKALTLPVAIWQQILRRLEAEKERIVEEITQYPPPIPACDAQFNSLLETRAALLQEIWQVKGILKQSLGTNEHLQLLNDFMRSSRHLGDAEGTIRQLLMMLSDADTGRVSTTS
jgi:hypothetical protein